MGGSIVGTLLVVGCWLLVVGCWLLVVGCWWWVWWWVWWCGDLQTDGFVTIFLFFVLVLCIFRPLLKESTGISRSRRQNEDADSVQGSTEMQHLQQCFNGVCCTTNVDKSRSCSSVEPTNQPFRTTTTNNNNNNIIIIITTTTTNNIITNNNSSSSSTNSTNSHTRRQRSGGRRKVAATTSLQTTTRQRNEWPRSHSQFTHSSLTVHSQPTHHCSLIAHSTNSHNSLTGAWDLETTSLTHAIKTHSAVKADWWVSWFWRNVVRLLLARQQVAKVWSRTASPCCVECRVSSVECRVSRVECRGLRRGSLSGSVRGASGMRFRQCSTMPSVISAMHMRTRLRTLCENMSGVVASERLRMYVMGREHTTRREIPVVC